MNIERIADLQFQLEKEGYTSWEKNPPKNKIVQIVYLTSKVFPVGAVVQAHSEEIEAGVTGDKFPTLWKEI